MLTQKKNRVLKKEYLVFKIKNIQNANLRYILPYKLFFLFSTLFINNLYSQGQFALSGAGSATGIVSSESEVPFWFYTNTSMRIGEFTNAAVYGNVNSEFSWGNNNIFGTGVSLMLRDGVEEEFQRENLFIEYKNNWLKASLGAKEREIYYNGLSATNGNMIWSVNARPMAGLILEANQPLRISNSFFLDWGIAHYSLNDDRYVTDTRVHYKRLGLIVKINDKHQIRGQLQHFAQWAGTSPDFGELPNDFEAFVDVFFARSGGEEAPPGEEQNSVGNHLGSYLLKYDLKTSIGDFSAYHEHPFEDGSGTGFKNFPDGVWAMTFSPSNKKIISHFLYEYMNTMKQSGTQDISGRDNYFNNTIYQSGWTYEGNIIGTPLYISDKSDNLPVISNRVKSHHFGIMGTLKKIDWVFKTTYSTSYGTYQYPFDTVQENWYNYVSFSYSTKKFGVISMHGGADTSNIEDTILGGGLSYKYLF